MMKDGAEKKLPEGFDLQWSGSCDLEPPTRRLYVWRSEMPANPNYYLIFAETQPPRYLGQYQPLLELNLLSCVGTSIRIPIRVSEVI